MRGLWRGVDATMVRALAGSSAQLTTFAKVKDALRDVESLKDKPVVISFIASIIGGIFQCIIMTPFDVVSTRLYNQGKFLITLHHGICTKFYWVAYLQYLIDVNVNSVLYFGGQKTTYNTH